MGSVPHSPEGSTVDCGGLRLSVPRADQVHTLFSSHHKARDNASGKGCSRNYPRGGSQTLFCPVGAGCLLTVCPRGC